MKKLLLLSLTTFLALTSCKNDSEENEIAYSVLGTWTPSVALVVSGSDGSTISSGPVTSCVQQSRYNYRSDGMVLGSVYSVNSSGVCGMSDYYKKSYTYDNVNRILIIGKEEYYTLEKLTDNEMYLVTDKSMDLNSDGVKDKKITVLVK